MDINAYSLLYQKCVDVHGFLHVDLYGKGDHTGKCDDAETLVCTGILKKYVTDWLTFIAFHISHMYSL